MEAQIKSEKLDGYTVTCPRCNKKLKAITANQVKKNFQVHEVFCKGVKE